MSGHTNEEKARWRQAAKAEGITVPEFGRRAMNDRANRVLDPMKGVIGGIAKAFLGAVVKELPSAKVCECGHEQGRHVNFSGNSLFGSCGSALCGCKKFIETGVKKNPSRP